MNQRPFKSLKTTRMGRRLLAATIILLPLEANFDFGGYSLAFILFGLLTVFALVSHPKTLVRTAVHPVFLVAYLFLLCSFAVESFHLNSNYAVINRTGQMFFGGVVVASYCRDPKALQTAIYSFLVMGAGMAIYLFLTVFGVLSGAVASDAGAASAVRNSAFNERLVQHNLNGIAYFVVLGAVVGLVLWTTSSKVSHRTWLMVVFLGCLLGVFLPMSRSGIFIVVVLCVFILFLHGRFRLRTLIMGLSMAVIMLFVVPDVVFSRMTFSFKEHELSGRREGRAQLLIASVDAISEEPLVGVGTGNFRGSWGMWSGFYFDISGRVGGAHNALAQIMVYWGILPALLWILLFWSVYRRLSRPFGSNQVSLFLFGLFMWMFLVSMFSHNIYDKSFALIFGVLVGFDRWIQPSAAWKHVLKTPLVGRSRTAPQLAH